MISNRKLFSNKKINLSERVTNKRKPATLFVTLKNCISEANINGNLKAT